MNSQTQIQIAKKIQWACNTQWDLMQRYEKIHGYASRHEIWAEYKQELKAYLSAEIQLDLVDHLAEHLYHFLVEHPRAYHLEMSSDEMANAFLDFLKND